MVDTIYDLFQSYEEYLIQHRKIAKEKTNHKLAYFFRHIKSNEVYYLF